MPRPSILHWVRPAAVRLRLGHCPGCGKSLMVKLSDDESAVRCVRCAGTPVHLAMVDALQTIVPRPRVRCAYEMSSRGPLLKYLKREFASVASSEFFPDADRGSHVDGIRCEDVQALTFPDASFDVCTSTEVFEHVPDDLTGFREVNRVLSPNGVFLFTVPLSGHEETVERAKVVRGEVIHLLEPAFHGDRITGNNSVLVFRDYGADICGRLLQAGFREARLIAPRQTYFGYGRTVVMAAK